MTGKLIHNTLVALILFFVFGLAAVGSVFAQGSHHKSETPVYWSWNFEYGDITNPVGASTLSRLPNGINGYYETDALTAGNAVTLWFIVFNYPENCLAGPYQCSPLDLGDTAAQGDFLVADGKIVGKGGTQLSGRLNVGDTSGSGLAEVMGCQECTPGLIMPESALVLLAVHDHGPAQTGQTLVSQISTFLGGCEGPFNGNEFGFATGLEDVPDERGECSTIQFSPHAP